MRADGKTLERISKRDERFRVSGGSLSLTIESSDPNEVVAGARRLAEIIRDETQKSEKSLSSHSRAGK